MKNRMKRLGVILTACVVSMSFIHTGVMADNTEDSGDKVITFWNNATQSPDKDVVAHAVEEFNANTKSGYRVENIALSGESYKEKLVVAMSAGECPDAYMHWTGGPMNEYIEGGFAQPLDELYEETGLIDEYMEGGLAQSTYDGHLYAVPTWNVTLSGIFYNTEIFEKYNLEIPTTLSELESVCDTLVENGIIPFALANAEKWTGSMYFMNLAARKGGLEPFQTAVDGSGTFEDECFIYAGEKIQEWVEKGYFPEGVNSLSSDASQATQLLYQEKAAMELIGSWEAGGISADNPEFYKKIDWFPFPAIDDSDADSSIQIGTIGDMFISFNCTDEKLKAAFEFATYFSSEGEKQLLADTNKIPPTKDAKDYVTDKVVKQILDAAEKASSVQLWYDQYLPPEVAQAHLSSCQELFGLTMTPEEAAEYLQSAMEDYLAEK